MIYGHTCAHNLQLWGYCYSKLQDGSETNTDALLNLLSVSIHFFIGVFIPHTLLTPVLNDIQYIIPIFSLPHTVSVHSCPPFSKIFFPVWLPSRLHVHQLFISMRLCEGSKLNALKPQRFNQMDRRPYLRKKHGQKLVDGDERAFRWVPPDERVCSHKRMNQQRSASRSSAFQCWV